MCSYDLDGPRAIRYISRVARKKHRCVECDGWIWPGETYVYVSGIWDHEPASFRQHDYCEELRTAIEEGPCGGHGSIPFGYLAQEVNDLWDPLVAAAFNAIRLAHWLPGIEVGE